jgi:hypothetical protein
MKDTQKTASKDAKRLYDQGHYSNNRESLKSWSRECYHNNKEAISKRRKAQREAYRLKVIEHLGGKCKRCGFDDIRALQIDHTNGGGIKDRAGLMYGFWKKVFLDTSGKYQLLCANCNVIKRIENGESRKP